VNLALHVMPPVDRQLRSIQPVINPGNPNSFRQIRQNVRSLWFYRAAPANRTY
jgi:hypothetical protein